MIHFSRLAPKHLLSVGFCLVLLLLAIFQLFGEGVEVSKGRGFGGVKAVEERFVERARIPDQMGSVLDRWQLGLGVPVHGVVEREGELFYLPDIEHLIGKGFLRRGGEVGANLGSDFGGENRNRDVISAVLGFRSALEEVGVDLVVMVTPSKGMMMSGLESGRVLRNSDFESFRKVLERSGVVIYDPVPILVDRFDGRAGDVFLQGDSHWTPEAMKVVSEDLSGLLKSNWEVSRDPDFHYRSISQVVENVGDLASMIGLEQSEKVMANSIEVEGLGEGWVSEVLLLGDSFCNIYSEVGMGWGEGAGFREHLSVGIGAKVDCVARNGDGAYSSRLALRENPGLLEGKKVVVWQFAARELSSGDWRVLPVSDGEAGGVVRFVEGECVVSGTVQQVPSRVGNSPYRHAVMEVYLTDVRLVRGKQEVPGSLVVLGVGIQDGRKTEMAGWKVGEEVELSLVPWEKMSMEFGSMRRLYLDDPEMKFLDLRRYWAR